MKKEVIRKEFCTCNIQDIIRRAEAEARAGNVGRIEISHLLIALLLCENSHAGTILSSLGVKPFLIIEDLRKQLEKTAQLEKLQKKLHFSYQAHHVFDFAKDEAIREGKGYIFSHHLLFAILHASQGNAAKTLARHGLNESVVRVKYKEIVEISREALSVSGCQCEKK